MLFIILILNNSPKAVNIKTVVAGVSFKDFSLIFFNATFKVWISVTNLFLLSKIWRVSNWNNYKNATEDFRYSKVNLNEQTSLKKVSPGMGISSRFISSSSLIFPMPPSRYLFMLFLPNRKRKAIESTTLNKMRTISDHMMTNWWLEKICILLVTFYPLDF